MEIRTEIFSLDNMVKGWFIGNFQPAAFQTNDVEVGIKYYKAGDFEQLHHHKIATEITVIQKGTVVINNEQYSEGDIIKRAPGDSADFRAITEVVTVVVKIPAVKNDKYWG